MGLTFLPRGQTHDGGLVADRRLYATARWTTTVEVGDDRARFLVAAGPGDVIQPRYVRLLRLTHDAHGRITWPGCSSLPALEEEPGALAAPAADEGLEEGAPEGTGASTSTPPAQDPPAAGGALVALPGGWYQWKATNGSLRLDEAGQPIKVRGKAAALEYFTGSDSPAAATEEES